MSDSDPELTSEERLRLLLSEAVEPVEPGPGAEARLQAKIRARQRPRDLPRRLRWAGAVLGTAAVVAGGVLVISTHHSSESSSSTSSAGSPVAAPASTSARPSDAASAAASQAASADRSAKEASPVAPSAQSGAGTTPLSAAAPARPVPQATSKGLNPQYQATTPSDLDGNNVSDQLTITGQRLVVTFQHSSQTVVLPPVGAGARVLGVVLLATKSGGSTPVAIVRLQADAAHARDTLIALVPGGSAGKLTVLKLDGKPVQLTVTGSQGYACAGPLQITAGKVTSYLVSGADLVANGSGGVARPGSNC